jgi:xanthosine utilization system XapX-like protein
MRRHHPHAAIGDRLDDLRRLAAPLPIVVGKVREALRSARIGTMTLHAIGQVQALAGFVGLLVGSQRRQIHLHVLGVQRLGLLFGLRHFLCQLTGRRPAQHALETAKTSDRARSRPARKSP